MVIGPISKAGQRSLRARSQLEIVGVGRGHQSVQRGTLRQLRQEPLHPQRGVQGRAPEQVQPHPLGVHGEGEFGGPTAQGQLGGLEDAHLQLGRDARRIALHQHLPQGTKTVGHGLGHAGLLLGTGQTEGVLADLARQFPAEGLETQRGQGDILVGDGLAESQTTRPFEGLPNGGDPHGALAGHRVVQILASDLAGLELGLGEVQPTRHTTGGLSPLQLGPVESKLGVVAERLGDQRLWREFHRALRGGQGQGNGDTGQGTEQTNNGWVHGNRGRGHRRSEKGIADSTRRIGTDWDRELTGDDLRHRGKGIRGCRKAPRDRLSSGARGCD
jgi:hypothetical protein